MPDTPQQLESNSGDRDHSGRFAPGNQAARGPRIAQKSTAYARALRQAISPQELAEVGRVLLTRALEGDSKAAAILFDRLLPRPTETLVIDNQFTDMGEATTKGEFRRAGANWKQIDQEFLEHLSNLIAEQALYEDQVAEYHTKLKAQQ